ncbi:MAG: hypothetical protein IPO17_12640 [Flavobacteriales bacterium]|nr:hypothetical protein [Flavobacteriales bacterium]
MIVCDAPCYNAATDTVYITVHDDPAPTLDYGIASICGDNGFVSPVAYSPLGGIFSSPLLGAALGAIGEIDLSLVATSATYTINYAIGGSCPQSISADLTIGLPPDAGDSDIMSICSNAAPVALFPLLGGDAEGGGTWTAPGGFAFGGTYDPAMHASGIYSYAVLGAAPCANETETITVTEVSAPNAGINGTLTVCSNGSARA